MDFRKYNLEDVCRIQIGKTPRREVKEYWGKGYSWVSISDMKSKVITITKEEITDVAVKVCGCKIIPKGTILLSFKLSIGKIAFAGKDLFTNEAIVGLEIKDKAILHPDYLYYILKNTPLVGSNNAAMGSTLNKESLRIINIPIPERLSDQLYIANILTQAENLIAQRKESIRLMDEFLKSAFLEMFGDNTKDDRSWKKIGLVEVCSNKNDIKCGPFGTQLGKSEYQIDGIPVWGIPQINSQFKILPKDFVTETKALELEDYSVIPFDIVMSRKGNVGKCSLFPEVLSKGIIHSDVLRIRTDKAKMLPVFLLFQLKFSKHVETQINAVSKGAIMAGINVGKLKHIKIHLPPIVLQTQFAQIVEKTEALKNQYQQSLQEIENLYGSLSQRAFKGELNIKSVN